MSALQTEIGVLNGIGRRRAAVFNKQGVYNLGDLLSFFPRGYEDRTVIKSIDELMPGQTACVRATVLSEARLARVRPGLDIFTLRVSDGASAFDLVFFNQGYVRDALRPGRTYIFYGKVEGTILKKEMRNCIFEPESGAGRLTGRIVPVYRLSAGLTQNIVSMAISQALDLCADTLPDALPGPIREKYGLAQARFAYENIHFPASFEMLELARRRLVFEELFILSVGLGLLKGRRGNEPGPRFERVDMTKFYNALPFALTGAQLRAVGDAVEDMSSGLPMNRLVQGDVGSGKTVVAAACAYCASKNGYQAALMAPTEILAEQHYNTLSGLLGGLGMRTVLLTGGLGTAARRKALSDIASGNADLVVGTHALISKGVEYSHLGLVITDEQHRFGVGQRATLFSKGENPHILVMSATPIPRTLALIIYGDLDISVIDELPPGRRKVDTFAVGEEMRGRIYAFMRKLAGQGRQIYIICPMVGVDEDSPAELKAVEEYAARLKAEVFPDLRVDFVHGRMKTKEKEAVMSSFRRGDTDILVATTVIEVGTDIPNAALMVVENAERFGLSQLHQLRGRVGRGEHKSYCVLFSSSPGAESAARLAVMCRTDDGFKISEEDLNIRGPGDFFGSRQHGLPDLRIASLAGDMRVLKQAQEAAAGLIDDDPELSAPEHQVLLERIRQLFRDEPGAFN